VKTVVLNQSSLKDYQNCQRLHAWRRLEGLEQPIRRSATEIGTAVHAGLALFHGEDPDSGDVEKAVELVKKTLSASAGPRSAFADKSLEDAETIATRTIRAYFEHWDKHNDIWTPLNQEVQFLVEVQPGWWRGTFEPESGVSLPTLQHTDLWLRGRLDNLSIVPGSGLYIVDYKTAGKMDPRDLLKYELDIQLTAYIYGLSRQLTEDSLKEGREPIAVRGAIIDLLVKTAVPQFAREMFTRTVDEMEEFEYEFVEYASRIREQLLRVDAGENWKRVFPRNTEHCFRYGTCAFRDLCLLDTEVRRLAFDKKRPDYVDDAQALLEKQKETP
jgi:RecB family exonuclease